MPWTPGSFRKKHAHALTPGQAKRASVVANAVLKHSGDEGRAIRVGIAAAKKHGRKK